MSTLIFMTGYQNYHKKYYVKPIDNAVLLW